MIKAIDTENETKCDANKTVVCETSTKRQNSNQWSHSFVFFCKQDFIFDVFFVNNEWFPNMLYLSKESFRKTIDRYLV